MAVYQYVASAGDRASALLRGTITADSPRQARDRLRQQGLNVRDLAEQSPHARSAGLGRYLAARQRGRLTEFLQEMATLLAAGIPLLEALTTLTRQHTGAFQRSVLLLRDHVASGGGLAEGMRLQPELFDELCVNIVEVGQNAGTLENALARLVEFRRKSARLSNRVLSALIYPCIVVCVGLAVSVFLMTYVVPNLLTVLLESGRPLPMATVVVKAFSDFLLGYWWLILLLAGTVLCAIAAALRRDSVRYRLDRLQLRVPLLGELVRKQAVARMSMVMATLLKSDLPFVRAVQIAQRTVGNRVLREALVGCERAVVAGRDISEALETTRAFPPLVIQVFAVGQASGKLESMLEDLATDYDVQVELAAGRLTAMLEPLLMILLAIVVGFIAFATILPILEAGNVL